MSPVYLNNPGFTLLRITGNSIEQVIESFQLQYYILFGEKFWVTKHPQEDLGIDLTDVDTIVYDVRTTKELGKFLGYQFGYDFLVTEFMAQFALPLFVALRDKGFLKSWMCMYSNYTMDDYQKCV